MDIRLLGAIEVRTGQHALPLNGPRVRTLLALLAMSAGRPVTTDRIVDVLWNRTPPAGVRGAIHTHVSALRRALADEGREIVVRCTDGYLLNARPDVVDVTRFEQLVVAGRQALRSGLAADAADRLGAALDVWCGPALSGAVGEWADRERARLDEFRLTVVEDRMAGELAVGRGSQVVDELSALVAAHPLRERLRAQLMMALCHGGRSADALACYHQGSRLLADELGIDPGAELRGVFDAILNGRIVPGETRRPRVVPPPVADFTGRAAEIGTARSWLTGSSRYVITGGAGVGKSALAIEIAHRTRSSFADGQLYVDLRGTSQDPVTPADALGRFLRAMDVDPGEDSLDHRADLYRRLTADRELLVILDDVADERQVRPLLPAGDRTATLLTSRRQLYALDGVRHAVLEVLGESESVTLLGLLAGSRRVHSELSAAASLVRLVGFLPLAVRVLGARLAARPDRALGSLLDRLRHSASLLDELTVGDLDVRASLAASHRTLTGQAQWALNRLAAFAEPAPPQAAATLDLPLGDATDVLDLLADAHMLVRTPDGRYRMPVLVRAFASELTRSTILGVS